MAKAVFCIATSEVQAEQIVSQLKDNGFSHNDISVLFPDQASSRHFAHEQHTKAPEGATLGGSVGGVVGGALGWLAGIGVLAIPGLGPFIAAGPLLAALSGAAVGGTVGGVAGVLVGMGIPEYEAKRYEGRIKSGNILISVHTDDHKEAKKARELFENNNAECIASASEAGADEKASSSNATRTNADAQPSDRT